MSQKGVSSLASSRASQNQLDLTDVAVAWAAFEEINSVSVEIECALVHRGPIREMQLIGRAYDQHQENTDQTRLVLVSATSWVMNHKTLDTAVFHLLYTLDGLIAEREFANAGNKEA